MSEKRDEARPGEMMACKNCVKGVPLNDGAGGVQCRANPPIQFPLSGVMGDVEGYEVGFPHLDGEEWCFKFKQREGER